MGSYKNKYSKNTTLSARLSDGELARVDRLAAVRFGVTRFTYSNRRPSRSDVIREALVKAEDALLEGDTKQGDDLRKLLEDSK